MKCKCKEYKELLEKSSKLFRQYFQKENEKIFFEEFNEEPSEVYKVLNEIEKVLSE